MLKATGNQLSNLGTNYEKITFILNCDTTEITNNQNIEINSKIEMKQ